MENNKFKFVINNMSTSNAPQYTERVSRSGWVNYGEDNLYPDYLISLMNMSAKHNAILKRKAMMIGGNGWDTSNLDGLAISFLSNSYNELNMDEIVFRSSYDLELAGAFGLEIIYSKDKTKIAEVNYLPINKLRLSDDNESVYFCNDWSNTRKFAPVKYPIYNPKNKTSNQILYFKEYRPGNEYYGQPEYISCVNWIETEYHISSFHLNQIKNGFMPSMVMNFTSIPSDDEMEETIKQLKNDYSGAQGETVMFLFSDGIDRAVQITPITLNNSDERFIMLNKEITQGILVGHSVTNPGLFGVSQEGELGQKSIILESLEMFQSMYIGPKQKLVEGVFNRLLKQNGSQSTLVLNKYKLDIEKIDGESEFSNDLVVDIDAQAKANLKGTVGGVQGILEIQKSVVNGTTDYEAALSILELIYGIDNERGVKILGEKRGGANE